MPIYLDNAATTPLDPNVLQLMLDCLQHVPGNPSSVHQYGRRARAEIENARDRIAASLGVQAGEIIFTCSGSEANNLALKGIVLRHAPSETHIVTTAIEHSSVLEPLRYLEERFSWVNVTYVSPGPSGAVTVGQIENALRPETVLISVMHANNETGILQPVGEIGHLAREHNILFHCDAIQSFGKVATEIDFLGCDFVSLSAHKIYGPKGAGLLYARSGVVLDALIHGGGQERWRRAGTENVPAIVGFAEAIRLALEQRHGTEIYLRRLEQAFLEELHKSEIRYDINGGNSGLNCFYQEDMASDANSDQSGTSVSVPDFRIPGTINIRFPGVRNEDLLTLCDLEGVCISAGSACHAGASDPSHVLSAMGLLPELIASSVRFSFGKTNTLDEARAAGEAIALAATRCCRLS